jgi:TetR/AcrR family transcriptional regulator, copper-responsive repressor
VRNSSKRTTGKGRGRPRSFDEQDALARITDLFWRHGYASTSLDAISRASGVGRPSLYATFGDKQALYLRAVDAFVARLRVSLAAAGGEETRLEQQLTALFASLLALYETDDGSGTGALGCLVICTAATEAVEQPRIREALNGVLSGIDLRLIGVLTRARDRGELAAGADIEGLAAVLAGTAHSLALRARAGASHESLERIAATAIGLIVPIPTTRHDPQSGAADRVDRPG